jgi:hypothetical protein
MRFEIDLSVMKLYNGRRSVYAMLRIGRRYVFLSRWDTARVTLKPKQIDIHRGPEMTWYAGVNTP